MARAWRSILLILVLVGTACSSGPDQSGPATTAEVSPGTESATRLLEPAEFAQYMDANPEVAVVNVHIPYEGHIEDTDSFVAFDEIADWQGLPEDRSTPLALYCRSGNMSAEATDTLEAMGFTDLVDLDGGMNAWTDAGYALLTEEPPTAN